MSDVRSSPDALAALDEERRFLLTSLADLEREHAAGDVADDDYRTLRDEYTARAATVLRALERGHAPVPAAPAGRAGRRFLPTILVTLAVAVGGAVLVARYVAPRAAGGSLTGDAPESIAQKLSIARQMQGTGDVSGAVRVYQDVLATDPDNAEARTYLGWMVANTYLSQGLTEATAPDVARAAMASSERQLDRAIAIDATYADPRCFKAIVRFRFYADAAGAQAAADACQAARPPAVVAGLVANLVREIDAALAARS